MFRFETLDKYVRRVLKEKELTLSAVERQAGGDISDSYVASITTGNVKNLSLEKLKALARGLGVTEREIFAVACGVPLPIEEDFQKTDFAELFYKYKRLSEEDKKQMQPILAMVNDEMERRLAFSECSSRPDGMGRR
jgi:transcriptional regulator with XRE-family HTH domain